MNWTKTKLAVVVLLAAIVLTIIILAAGRAIHSERAAHYPNIQGAWEGTVDLAKAALRVRLNISKTNGVYFATADSVDQGARNIPVGKIVYDYPNFHFEMNSIGGAFDGKLNAPANEMSGNWKQGKNSHPLALKFTTHPLPETLSDEAVAPTTNSEAQGVWQGTLALKSGLELRVKFKIAEPSPGTVYISLDSLDQGANDIMASSASYQDHVLQAGFEGIGGTFTGQVNGQAIAGMWKQGGKSLPLNLTRAEAPDATEPEPIKTYYITRNDLPGHWKGMLHVKDVKLRLVFNIAKLADGTFSATLDSPDQGAENIPASDTRYTAPKVHIAWRAIGGSFDGDFKNGKLTGKWQQGGMNLPLVLTRG